MPIANLMILEGRAPEVKQALIRAVTNAIVDSLLVKPESVRVVVQEIPPQHWGIGGVSAKDLGR
jgi:4-oxalocrotonate tautomerase